jgi:hypothetical protein
MSEKKKDVLKANNDEMNELHQMVAQKLKRMLSDPECTVQDINAAIKFLKDNNVTADIEYSKPLQMLEQEVTPVGQLPFVDDEEEDEAVG